MAVIELAHEHVHGAATRGPASGSRDNGARRNGGPVEERLGEQSPERRRAGQLVALGAEQSKDRSPGIRVVEMREEVPVAELIERVGTAARAERLDGDGEVLLRSSDLGDAAGRGVQGSLRICLAIVSSCICCDPP